mmetsp:Transcript_14004/g.45176  ORF Transcript_14004/g.45176 Transcript_14004/m.45176 type:complete len:249 (-) Transcript_14004:55-801(-)
MNEVARRDGCGTPRARELLRRALVVAAVERAHGAVEGRVLARPLRVGVEAGEVDHEQRLVHLPHALGEDDLVDGPAAGLVLELVVAHALGHGPGPLVHGARRRREAGRDEDRGRRVALGAREEAELVGDPGAHGVGEDGPGHAALEEVLLADVERRGRDRRRGRQALLAHARVTARRLRRVDLDLRLLRPDHELVVAAARRAAEGRLVGARVDVLGAAGVGKGHEAQARVGAALRLLQLREPLVHRVC